jgi:LysR family glycine cleavage system transcriptional activator
MLGAPQLPPLPSVHAFEAAARLGGFAKAARELGTTPAAVSYHVRRLERRIGVALFDRHAQRVTLTVEGAAIAAEATTFFAALRRTFASTIEAHESRLAVTTLPTLGASWLTPRLGRFRKLHEDIAVELDLSETAHELGGGRFDVAIRNGGGKWPGLRAVELFPSIFMPLCSPALKDAARNIADPRRGLDAPLLGRPDWWALWYEALGLGAVDLSGRFGVTLQAEYLDKAAAIAGHGITIGSPILFADDIEAGRLVPAHDFVTGDGRSFWLVYPVIRERSSKIAKFRAWLCAEAEQARRSAPARPARRTQLV